MNFEEHLGRAVMKLAGITQSEGQETRTQHLAHLFEQAQESIKIVSGRLPEDIYASPEVYDHMARLLQEEGTVEIMAGPEVDENNTALAALRRLSQTCHLDGFHFYPTDQEPDKHYTVVDGKHARLEPWHPPGEDRTQYVIRGYKNANSLARRFDRTIYKLTQEQQTEAQQA